MKLVTLAAFLLGLAAAQTCPQTPAGTPSLNCKICNDASVATSPMQVMPRPSLGSVSIPDTFLLNQLSSYTDYLKIITQGAADSGTQLADINNYVEGMVLYILIPVLSLIFVIPFSLLFCCGRYCCCCITGGCCGNRNPTPKGVTSKGQKFCCNCCGFNPKTKKYGYCSKACAYIYMILFIGLTLFFALTAFFSGNAKIPTGITSLATKSPTNLANLASSLQTPAMDMVTKVVIPSVIGPQGLVPTIYQVINSTVDLKAFVGDINCIASIVTDNLPNFTTLGAALNVINNTLTALPTAAALTTLTNDFATASNSTTSAAGNLTTVLTTVNNLRTSTAFTLATSDLAAANSSMTNINYAGSDITSQFTNNISPVTASSTITTETNAYQIMDAAVPTLQTPANSSPPNSNIAGTTSATRTSLLAYLATLKVIYSAGATGAYTAIADLRNLNSNVTSAKSSLQNVVNDLNGFSTLVAALPTGAQLNSTIDSLIAALQSVPLPALLNILNQIDGDISPGGGFDVHPLINMLAVTAPISSKISCVNDLMNQVQSFQSLVVMNITSLIPANITGTFQTIVGTIASVNSTLYSVLPTFATQKANLDIIIGNITTANDLILTAIGKLNSVKSSSVLIDTVKNQTIDTSPLTSAINNLNTTDPTIAANLQTLGDNLSQVSSNVTLIINQINSWDKVVGSATAPDYILMGYTAGAIQAFSTQPAITSPSIPNIDQTPFSALQTALTAGNSQLGSILDVGSFGSLLTQLSTGVATINSAVGPNLALIGNIAGMIPSSAFGAVTGITQGGILDSLNSVLTYVPKLNAGVKEITTGLPDLYTTWQSTNYGGATNLNDLITNVINGLNPILANLNQTYDFRGAIAPYQGYINAITYTPTTNLGPVYYFYNLYAVFSNMSAVNTDTGKTAQVLVDSLGNPRPSGVYCLTTDCITNTVNQIYNVEPVGNVALQYGKMSFLQGKDGGLSVNNILTIVIFITLIPVAIGLLSMLCFCSGRFNPSICTAYSACVLIIPVSIISIVLVPLFFVISDGCQNLENIGGYYVAGNAANACTTLGGVYDNVNLVCVLNVNVGGSKLALPLDINGIYGDLLGGSCVAGDPSDKISNLILGIGSKETPALFNIINSTVTPLINQYAGPALQSSVNASLYNLVGNTQPFFTSLSKTINCGTVGPAVKGLKDGVCCYVVNPFTFIGSCFFGILLCYIFLGIPAGIIGKKRFPWMLWGSFVNDDPDAPLLPEGTPQENMSLSKNEPGSPNSKDFKFSPLPGGPGAGAYDLQSFDAEYDRNTGTIQPFEISGPKGSLV